MYYLYVHSKELAFITAALPEHNHAQTNVLKNKIKKLSSKFQTLRSFNY